MGENLITMQRKKFVYWYNSVYSTECLPINNIDDPAGLGEESVALIQEEMDFYCRLSMITAVSETLGEVYFNVNSVCLCDNVTISMVYYKDILLEIVVERVENTDRETRRKRRFFQPKYLTKNEIVDDFALIMQDSHDYTCREYIDCVDKNEIDIISLLQTYENDNKNETEFTPPSDFGSDWI